MPETEDNIEPARVAPATLAEILQVEIRQGRFALGSALPSDAPLRTGFCVGRHTVRVAGQRLEEAGLVEKRQGARPRVLALPPKSGFVHSVRSLAEVIQFTLETQLEVEDRAVVALQSGEAEFVSGTPGTRWLRLRGVRRGVNEEAIIGFSTIFVHGRFAPILGEVRFPKGPLYSLIEAATGEVVHEAEQKISAGPLPANAARKLNLTPGETAIRVTRHYFDMSGGIMLASLNWHSPTTFSYVISLRRDQMA